jgi:perosamine synthetase
MYHIVLGAEWVDRRSEFRTKLMTRGIETRECFLPFDQQEVFINEGIVEKDTCPVAGHWGNNGLYLPSGPRITESELSRVIESVTEVLSS